MHSPGHRSNLLNPKVDHVGVAVVAGRNGLYAVADYERAVPVLTQAQIESQVAGLLARRRHPAQCRPGPHRLRRAKVNCRAPRPVQGHASSCTGRTRN